MCRTGLLTVQNLALCYNWKGAKSTQNKLAPLPPNILDLPVTFALCVICNFQAAYLVT